MHARSERLLASRTHCRSIGIVLPLTSDLIKLYAKLGWTLEDVKELPEREIHECRYDGNRVQDGDEAVEASAEPHLRDGQGQAGDGDREQQDDWEKVHRHCLHCTSTFLAKSPP